MPPGSWCAYHAVQGGNGWVSKWKSSAVAERQVGSPLRSLVAPERNISLNSRSTSSHRASSGGRLSPRPSRQAARPATHQSPLYGWAGWIHWETSGAHFYAWDEPAVFFSVDVYACKAFSPHAVVELTREWFDATEVVFKEF